MMYSGTRYRVGWRENIRPDWMFQQRPRFRPPLRLAGGSATVVAVPSETEKRAGAMVVLIPKIRKRITISFRRDQTDFFLDGSFTLFNVVPDLHGHRYQDGGHWIGQTRSPRALRPQAASNLAVGDTLRTGNHAPAPIGSMLCRNRENAIISCHETSQETQKKGLQGLDCANHLHVSHELLMMISPIVRLGEVRTALIKYLRGERIFRTMRPMHLIAVFIVERAGNHLAPIQEDL